MPREALLAAVSLASASREPEPSELGGAGGGRAAVAAWGHAAGKAEEIARGQEGDDSMQPLRAMTAGRQASGATTPPLAGPA